MTSKTNTEEGHVKLNVMSNGIVNSLTIHRIHHDIDVLFVLPPSSVCSKTRKQLTRKQLCAFRQLTKVILDMLLRQFNDLTTLNKFW